MNISTDTTGKIGDIFALVIAIILETGLYNIFLGVGTFLPWEKKRCDFGSHQEAQLWKFSF